ncbi:actin-fragmin kinase [Acrasis kona]|uniref:Actin-fragmin kinase n=1 Tax=Acrasis kona TaxID=1008807 RepID=A0AAW2ZJF0_9EUKA
MSIFNALRRRKEPPLTEPLRDDLKYWVKQESFVGAFEPRAKSSSVLLGDGRIFVFGGQTNKKEIDNSCFIIEEKISEGTSTPKSTSTTSITKNNKNSVSLSKIDVKPNDLKRQISEGTKLLYFVTNAPIVNPHESPPCLRSHSAVMYNNKVVIFGGKNRTFCNATYILNTITWEWQHVVCLDSLVPTFVNQKKGNNSNAKNTTRRLRLPQPRCSHSAVMLGNKMIVYGGVGKAITKTTLGNYYQNTSFLTNKGDLWSFDVDTQQWQEIEPKGGIIPPARHSHVAIALNDSCMLVWGGSCTATNNISENEHNSETSSPASPTSNETQSINNNLCWLFDFRTQVWSPFDCPMATSQNEFSRSSAAGIRIHDGLLLFFGGLHNRLHLKDFVVLDLQKRSQYILDPLLDKKHFPSSRRGHEFQLIGNHSHALIFGGFSRKRGRLDDCHVVDLQRVVRRALFEQRHSEACDRLQIEMSAMGSEPEQPDSMWYLHRASMHITLHNYTEAVQDLDQCLYLLKNLSMRDEALEQRANCYFALNLFEECEQDIQAIGPYKSEKLTWMLAHCLIHMGQISRASTLLEAFTSGQPGSLLSSLSQKVSLYEKAEREQKTRGYKNVKYASGVDKSTYEPLNINNVMGTTTVATSNQVFRNVSSVEREDLFLTGGMISYEDHYLYDDKLTFEKGKSNLVLVVGGGPSSGCTTFMQQIRLAYRKSMSPVECMQYKTDIRARCVYLFFRLLQFKDFLNLYFEKNPPIDGPSQILFSGESKFLEENLKKAYESVEPNTFENKDFCFVREQESLLNQIVSLAQDKTSRMTFLKKEKRIDWLSNPKLAQELLNYDSTLYECLMDANDLSSYVNDFEYIFANNYEPSTNHVLRLPHRDSVYAPDEFRRQVMLTPRGSVMENSKRLEMEKKRKKYSMTTSKFFIQDESDDDELCDLNDNFLMMASDIQLHRERNSLSVMYKTNPYRIINPQRGNSLEDLSSGCCTILLFVNLGDFDRTLSKDLLSTSQSEIVGDNLRINSNSSSGIVSGLHSFDNICNLQDFFNVPIIVVFTKFDVFVDKTRRKINLKCVFPDIVYGDGSNESIVSDSQSYLQQSFDRINGNNKRKVHYHYIDTLDSFDCCRTFKVVDELVAAVDMRRSLAANGMM